MANSRLFSVQIRKLEGDISKKLLEAGRAVEGEMHNLVAIDTGTLNESIKTGNVERIGDIFSVEVGSEGVEYAKWVENSSTVKNYHRGRKPKGKDTRQIVYTGAGQKWAERSLKNKASEILDILKS